MTWERTTGLPIILSLISPVSSCPAVSGFIGNVSVVVSYGSCFVIRVVNIDVVKDDNKVNIVVVVVDDDDSSGDDEDVIADDDTVDIVVFCVVVVGLFVVGVTVGGCGGFVSLLYFKDNICIEMIRDNDIYHLL